MAVLPTRYGKSLIFHVLPSLFLEKMNSQSLSFRPVIIVVLPLNVLIKDQIRSVKNAKRKCGSSDLELDASDANYTPLKDAKYEMIFMHPEAFVSCKDGMELFQSQQYQRVVKAVIVDKMHCILEWRVVKHPIIFILPRVFPYF